MSSIQIIPTVFALDKISFDKKLECLSFCKKLHLDFMDGEFTKNKSVQFLDMNKILEYSNIFFEVHLMAKNPILYLDKILEFNIKKVLIQFEIFKTETDLKNCVSNFKEKNIEVFLVVNLQTDVGDILKYIPQFNGVMFMSVFPGVEGQKFIVDTLDKIRHLRMFYPKLKIQIDGGIKDENIKKVIKMGVDIVSVGSYISSNKNPKESFEKLEKIINK